LARAYSLNAGTGAEGFSLNSSATLTARWAEVDAFAANAVTTERIAHTPTINACSIKIRRESHDPFVFATTIDADLVIKLRIRVSD
jgi:hypothetical protein